MWQKTQSAQGKIYIYLRKCQTLTEKNKTRITQNLKEILYNLVASGDLTKKNILQILYLESAIPLFSNIIVSFLRTCWCQCIIDIDIQPVQGLLALVWFCDFPLACSAPSPPLPVAPVPVWWRKEDRVYNGGCLLDKNALFTAAITLIVLRKGSEGNNSEWPAEHHISTTPTWATFITVSARTDIEGVQMGSSR